jgi:glycerol-3-phosphate dehydrogenase
LLADRNGNPSDISRSHEIRMPEPGWWDVAGGKLTTYRLMAEQTVDQLLRWMANSSGKVGSFSACRTAEDQLLPSDDAKNSSGILPPEFCRQVVEHYCGNEWAVHLDDVMVRRTSWHYYHRDAATKAQQVADWMGELLGWSKDQRNAELSRYLAIRHCQWSGESSSSTATQPRNDRQTLPMV